MRLIPDTAAKSNVMESLAAYYAKRAPEYDRIYHKPERQEDLRTLRTLVAKAFADRSILEIACGTGYWTEVLSKTARQLVATDINAEVIAIARAKSLGDKVQFVLCDAFQVGQLAGQFDAAFAAFWWSHVTRADLPRFLSGLEARLKPGGKVVFIDNNFVEGNSTPIARRDAEGNTYQLRQLDDSSSTEVLKNFPTNEEITTLLPALDLSIERLKYYWYASYTAGT
jgi:ubiquinone/menaquinone biosynthesis C-methylase UbiE